MISSSSFLCTLWPCFQPLEIIPISRQPSGLVAIHDLGLSFFMLRPTTITACRWNLERKKQTAKEPSAETEAPSCWGGRICSAYRHFVRPQFGPSVSKHLRRDKARLECLGERIELLLNSYIAKTDRPLHGSLRHEKPYGFSIPCILH